MFNVAFSLFLVALALNVESAFGKSQGIDNTVKEKKKAEIVFATNQHLICKTVDDVFSNGTRCQDIDNAVKEEMKALTRAIQERIETLEKKVLELNAIKQVTRDFQERIETLEAKVLELNATKQDIIFWCGGGGQGFYYKTKCYSVILLASHVPYIQYIQSSELCTQKGGRPADILNAEHQSLVADYVRKKKSGTVEIWIGMSYKDDTLRFFNGDDVPGDVAASLRWWADAPYSDWSSVAAMEMVVDPTTYGITNLNLKNLKKAVLCEK